MRSHVAVILMLSFSAGILSPVWAANDKNDANSDGKEKKEKEKEPPLKCSAWCAFKDIVSYQQQQATFDPKAPLTERAKTETRLGSSNWAGFGRRGQWATIVLELQNTTEKTTYTGTGSIVLNTVNENQNGQIPYKTNYRQDLDIGPGTTKQYRFSVLCPEDWGEGTRSVEVNINTNGLSDSRIVTLVNLDALREEFIAVVSESSGFGYLTGTKGKRAQPDELDPDEKKQQRQVAWVEATDLPSRWHDLTLANLIIIDGPPLLTGKLSDTQWAALKSYVQAGGHILVTAGKDPSRLKGPLEDLCGIEVRGTADIESLDEVRPTLQPAAKDWAMTIMDVKVNEDARHNAIVRRNRKTGCVEMCKRFYGAGSVTFLPFSLNDPKLALWPGRTSIPTAIIERGAISTLFGQMSPEDIENIRAKPTSTIWGTQTPPAVKNDALVKLRQDLDQSFSADTPVVVQKSASVLSFLLLYLLCAVPGNYFLFGWLRRREIAWLAVPLWGASFSLGAWWIGYSGQTGRLTVNELTIIEAGPSENVGMARTYFGIYAPRRDEYQVEFPSEKSGKNEFDVQAAPGHLVNVANEDARSEMPSLSIVDSEAGLSIEKMLVQQRSTRRLEITHRTEVGDGLDVRVNSNAADEKAMDIEVINKTGYDLTSPVYVYQEKAIELHPAGSGDVLGKDQSIKLLGVGSADGTQWIEKDKAFFGKSVVFRKVRGKWADARTAALKAYLRERVDKFHEGAVLAWIERAPLPVEILDSSHGLVFDSNNRTMDNEHFAGLTLLMVPVSVKHGSSSNPAPRQKGPIPVRYSLTYTPGETKSRWQPMPINGVPMVVRTNSYSTKQGMAAIKGNNEQTIVLEFKAPDNPAELHNEGCHLRMRFTLFAGDSVMREDSSQVLTVTGNMSASVEKRNDNASFEWEQLTEAPINDLKPGKSIRIDSFDIPLGDFRKINNNTIHVQLKADISDISRMLRIKDAVVEVEED